MKQQKFFVGDVVKRTKWFTTHKAADGGSIAITDVEQDEDGDIWLGFYGDLAEWDENCYTIVERAWQENDGTQGAAEDTYIEILFNGATTPSVVTVEKEWWENTKGMVKWRIADEYENPKEFFEQEQPAEAQPPVCATPPAHVALGEDLVATQQEWTDKHYSSEYVLTQKDIDKGFVKIDPYFVSKMWKIGSKDDSGALWHCFKTIARFGEKNSREREIKALYAQIKRLAELEGVVLE